MPQIYTNGFQFAADSGVGSCVELPAPPRGLVRRFILKQVSGVLEGFTANLLDRQDACVAVSEVSSTFEGATPATENKLLDKEAHRILPEISVAVSSALSEQYGLQSGYQNRNEQDIRRTPDSRIYLDVNPGGTGSKGFQVAYSVEPVENI